VTWPLGANGSQTYGRDGPGRPSSRHDKVTLLRPNPPGRSFRGDAAVGTLRSGACHVGAVFIFLISTLMICGVHAQTAADTSGNKRVQVLEIRDATASGESPVSKTKPVASKKKVAKRKSHGDVKAAASEEPPQSNLPVQSARASVAPVNTAGNEAQQPSAEQTGILSVAFTSVPGTENTGLSVGNSDTSAQQPPARALADGNSPRSMPDGSADQAARQVRSNGNTPLAQSAAMLGGATLAAVFGWFLVGPGRKRNSVGAGA
jgi:hypothetical protein